MGLSNYDKMLEAGRKLFLDYDQSTMVRKFHLQQDDTYLYLSFIKRPYRIEKATGFIQWLDEDNRPHDAGFHDGMSIYDVLCYSRPDCHLSGQFGPINSVASSYHTAGLGESLFDERATVFSKDPPKLERICEALGGTKEGKGDIAYRLEFFPFLPVRLQFWMADEEFPASIQLHWDLNSLDFVHYETTYYMAGHLFARLRELMEDPDI